MLFLGGILASSQVAFAQNASLYFVPSTGTVVPGQTLTVQVMVNTGGAQVNAVGAYFTYPDTLLEGLSIDTTGSVLDTFTPEKTVEDAIDCPFAFEEELFYSFGSRMKPRTWLGCLLCLRKYCTM